MESLENLENVERLSNLLSHGRNLTGLWPGHQPASSSSSMPSAVVERGGVSITIQTGGEDPAGPSPSSLEPPQPSASPSQTTRWIRRAVSHSASAATTGSTTGSTVGGSETTMQLASSDRPEETTSGAAERHRLSSTEVIDIQVCAVAA